MVVGEADCEAIEGLLDQLDVQAQQQHTGEIAEDYWVCQRRHPRYRFRADCRVYFFPMGTSTLGSLPARARNLSCNGIGLVVRRPFTTGEPLEVEIQIPGRNTLYLAGLVAFCRYAGRGYHELGLRLRTASAEPVFSKNPQQAIDTIDWLKPQPKTM